jgi:hypothetical protein
MSTLPITPQSLYAGLLASSPEYFVQGTQPFDPDIVQGDNDTYNILWLAQFPPTVMQFMKLPFAMRSSPSMISQFQAANPGLPMDREIMVDFAGIANAPNGLPFATDACGTMAERIMYGDTAIPAIGEPMTQSPSSTGSIKIPGYNAQGFLIPPAPYAAPVAPVAPIPTGNVALGPGPTLVPNQATGTYVVIWEPAPGTTIVAGQTTTVNGVQYVATSILVDEMFTQDRVVYWVQVPAVPAGGAA